VRLSVSANATVLVTQLRRLAGVVNGCAGGGGHVALPFDQGGPPRWRADPRPPSTRQGAKMGERTADSGAHVLAFTGSALVAEARAHEKATYGDSVAVSTVRPPFA
jgi:hypothetical protein